MALTIKNIPAFREKVCSEKDMSNLDPHFVGAKQKRVKLDDTVEITFGFFDHINGSTRTIRNKLTTNLNMAQDTQAIFEFVQNAVDADATDFFMYYDDTQFLAFNNGEAFSYDDIYSIIRVGASNKVETASDEEFIGRFGVGFKLIHRMVGAQNGVDEMINDYAGPMMFSWSNEEQLRQLRNVAGVADLTLGNNDLSDASPWLFKFLLTCFPTLPQTIDSNVRDLQHREVGETDQSLFSEQELQSFISFLNEFWEARREDLKNIDLSEGSLFYLKLGKGKKEEIEKYIDSYKSGLNYSLKFTETISKRRGLKNIYFNDHDVISSEQINLEVDDPIHIYNDDPEYDGLSELLEEKDQGINITFRFAYEGYPDRSDIELGSLKDEPNFFKYFPMGKENHKLNFILHCNVFSIESSRREFQQDDDLNKELLKNFTNRFKKRLDSYREEKKEAFRNIFLSVLFSDDPIEKQKDAKWISDLLFNPLHKYFLEAVPVIDGGFEEVENVVIKNTSLPVDSSLIEGEKQWFRYAKDSEVNSQICERAEEVMNVPSWNLAKIIEKMSSESFSNWYTSLNAEQQGQLKEQLSDQLSSDLKTQFWKNIQVLDGIYELIKECEVYGPKKKFVLSFDKIVLKKETITAQNKNLLDLLDIAKEFEEDEQFLDEFQDSCRVISDGGDEYKLKDVAQKDSVTFTIDKEDYNLPLSEILPEKYQETSGVFQPILDAFNELELDFSTLLGIKGERNKNNLAEHIESEFESYTSTQFVFFLLYSMEKETQKFKKKPDIQIALEALDYFFKKDYPFPEDYEKYFDGMHAEQSVYPNSMAIKEERLPESIIEWIEEDEEIKNRKIEYLAKGGLKTEAHEYIELRKLLSENRAAPDNTTDLDELNRSDLLNLFAYLKQKKPVITGQTRDIFKTLTGRAALHNEITKAGVPFPVFQSFENDAKLKLLSYNEDIRSQPSYILDNSYFNKPSEDRPCILREIVDTFISSEALLIDGRFIHEKYHIPKSVKPSHHNDIERGKEVKLYIDGVNALFVYQFENETEYEVYFFEGGPPRCIKYNEFVFRRYEGNRFYIDHDNKTIFAGHISNTSEQELYDTLNNYFGTFANTPEDELIHQKFKRFNPDDSDNQRSKSDVFKKKVKEAELFTGEWLKHAVHWEKARTEEKHFKNRRHYFNDVVLDNEGRILLSDYHKDIVPTFFDVYDNPVEISFYSDSQSKLPAFDAPIHRTNDFEVEVLLSDDQKGKIKSIIQSNKVKAYVRLGEEDPWLKQLSQVLFGDKLIEDDDRLEDKVTHLWAEEELSFIFGPPGTGKTTKSVLCALHDLAQARKADCKARILILTPTNKAADVFIEKAIEFFKNPNLIHELEIGLAENEKEVLYNFLENEFPSSYLYRYGTHSSKIIPFSLIGKSLHSPKQSLVATTVHRYVSEPGVNSFNNIDSENGVSKVILDEASMISLPHILYVLLSVVAFDNYQLESSKLASVTIAGDPFQLKPVGLTPNPIESQPGWSTESIYTLLKLHKFDLDKTAVGNYGIDNLKTQYRSSRTIGELYSDYCYEGLLKHHHEVLNSPLDSEFEKSIHQILFQVHKLNADEYPLTKIQRYGKYSSYHLYSAILAIELAAKIRSSSDETILLITPYGIQARILEDIIKTDDLRFTEAKIAAGTIHSSQGNEADHVILVQNPPKLKTGQSSFFNNQNIINVAISRAKKKLFVLMPDPSMMATNSYELKQNVLTDGHDIQSYNTSRFEEQVWNDSNYIKDQIEVANYSDFIVENSSKIDENKRYKFYAGDGKVFSWFNPGKS